MTIGLVNRLQFVRHVDLTRTQNDALQLRSSRTERHTRVGSTIELAGAFD
jgi:hypothetical protein